MEVDNLSNFSSSKTLCNEEDEEYYSFFDQKEEDENENEETGPSCEEESVFTDETHSCDVLKSLQNLRKNGLLCDVTLLVEGRQFPVHRNVLASLSPYFKAMFTSTLAEANKDVVAISGVERSTMELLLDYAYTGTLTINLNNVQSLLSGANLLQFNAVKEAASVFLEKRMNISNCIGIFVFAELHSCSRLIEKVMEYILKNIREVTVGDEFLNLSSENLIEFIKRAELKSRNEVTVLRAVMKWFLQDSKTRKVDLRKVLKRVNLPLLSSCFLHDFVENVMTQEAKIFNIYPDRRAQLLFQWKKHRLSDIEVQVILAAGGHNEQEVLSSVDCYNPASKKWNQLFCLPHPLTKHSLVVSGRNTLYVVGGEKTDSTSSNSVFQYDFLSNTWVKLAPMHELRSELGVIMIDDCIYAAGGWDGAYTLDSVEKYNVIDNSSEIIYNMEDEVASPACVAHNGLLYVMGGAVLGEEEGLKLVHRYDPSTKKWCGVSAMLTPRSCFAACVLDDFIYVLGGTCTYEEGTETVERYDIKNDKWSSVASMCEKRHNPGAAVWNGRIFVFGGNDLDKYSKSIEFYDPKKNTWTLCGEMPSSRTSVKCATITIKASLLLQENHS